MAHLVQACIHNGISLKQAASKIPHILVAIVFL